MIPLSVCLLLLGTLATGLPVPSNFFAGQLTQRTPPSLNLIPSEGSPFNYAKMGFDVVKREEAASFHEISLNNYKSLYYLVDVKIGTPKQNIRAMLDTGSSDVIIESVQNPYCKASNNSEQIKQKDLQAGLKKSSASSDSQGTQSSGVSTSSSAVNDLYAGYEGSSPTTGTKEPSGSMVSTDELLTQSTNGQVVDSIPVNSPAASSQSNADNKATATSQKTASSSATALQKRKNIINDNPALRHLHKRKNIITGVSALSPALNKAANDGVQNKAVLSSTLGTVDCFRNGFFAANLSSTFHLNSTDALDISYGDGETSTGYYGTDDATISGVSISQLNFGLVESGDTALAVMGIGQKSTQAIYVSDGHSYDSLPYQIKQQKNLKKAAYSIALGGGHGDSGTLLFGAVDAKSYTGDFATMSFGTYNSMAGFYVPIDSIAMYYEGVSKGITMLPSSSSVATTKASSPASSVSTAASVSSSTLKFRQSSKLVTALLDTGSTLCHFPQKIYDLVGRYVPHKSATANGYVVDCAVLENENNFFRYGFNKGAVYVDVPFSEYNLTISRSGNQCTLGMGVSSDGESATLGDPFFRRSVVVFDLEDQTVSIAQATKGNTTEEKMFLIG